jgi:hypothetical protein
VTTFEIVLVLRLVALPVEAFEFKGVAIGIGSVEIPETRPGLSPV